MRKLVAGNWKMNGTRAMLGELGPIAEAASKTGELEVAVFPPFTLIAAVAEQVEGVAVGGQDCHSAAKGAHTGCVSADMLVDAGATMVILGHSERRADCGETDAIVRAKAEAAAAAGLVAIVCVGESEAERDAGREGLVVAAQLEGSLPPSATAATLVVAYEPIWAIGTGKTASPADVGQMHELIRAKLVELFGEEGRGVRILYGGSVKPDNARELMAVPDVDGALVGGASLTAAQFVPIIEGAVG